MKRTREHEIDSMAQKLLEAQCPLNWVKRGQCPDYGIDYEVQVFDNEISTDIWFRIQLKGKEKYRETPKFIKIQFETDKLVYYMTKVPFPVFLIVVHTRKKEIHWIFIQKYVNEILKKENPEWMKQKTVTVNIPKKNVFKDAKKIEIMAREGMEYTHQLVFGIPNWSLSFKTRGALDDINKFEKERKRHFREQNEMDLQLALQYFELADKEKSGEMFLDVFTRTQKDKDSVLEHLSSTAGMISLYSPIKTEDQDEIINMASYGYEIAEKINNNRFKCQFKGLRLEASYYKVKDKIFKKQMLQKIPRSEKGIGKGVNSLLHLFQSQDYNDLLEISSEYSKNLHESFENKEYLVALDLLIRSIQINLYSYMDSTRQQSKDELKPLLAHISDLINNATVLAEELDHIGYQCEVLKYKTTLFFVQNDKEYKDIIQSMMSLATKNNMQYYVKASEDLLKECNRPFPEGPEDWSKLLPSHEERSDDEIDEMYRILAEGAGINLDSDDPDATIVNIGLADRNPERILKNCSNLEVATGSCGIPGITIGLHTAGSKFLFCKHGTGFYGLKLDDLYQEFIKKGYCQDCEHQDPMPNDWKWSIEWQQRKDNRRTPEFQRFIDVINEKSFKIS